MGLRVLVWWSGVDRSCADLMSTAQGEICVVAGVEVPMAPSGARFLLIPFVIANS